MTPGPSFTVPATLSSAPTEINPQAGSSNSTEQRQFDTAQASAPSLSYDVNAQASSSTSSAALNESVRRSEASQLQPQPKHCSHCGQLLDGVSASHDRPSTLPRTPSSASISAPSPSSYAFAPDSIRSQHRLQPGQSLTSAINAAAAVALSRHLGTDEPIPTDADGHAICTSCATQLAENDAIATLQPHASLSASTNDVPATSSHPSELHPHDPDASTQEIASFEMRSASDDGSHTAALVANGGSPSTAIPQINAQQAPLTISVDNMGAGGDAAPAQSTEDVLMHDSSATVLSQQHASLSPSLRDPSSAPATVRSTSRGRIRFADASTTTEESRSSNGDQPAAASSSSSTLGRSGSFSRSLSYSGSGLGPESVSSSAAPVVVSFPPASISTPATESAPTLMSPAIHVSASSLTPPVSSLVPSPHSQSRSRSSSSSNSLMHASASSQTAVPAPALAVTGGIKQRRPSSARRPSRSGSSTGPTTLPFAAVGNSTSTMATSGSKDGDPYGPSSVTRPRLSLLSTQVIANELYNLARQTRPASLISASTSTSLAASSSEHAVGIDPARAVRYHLDPLSYSHTDLSQQQQNGKKSEEITSMDVDEEKVSLGSAAKLDNVRWFDPYKPDPLAELSRLRVPPKGRGCLYPGATFNGTQKSGRNSYDVTVRIVNVDLEASHLCGYLNIRGLTEDWPELTTYFDAEIIGDQYGFVTGKWGATEADDLKHWARFAPFRPLRSALSKPGLRFNHLNKPFVFMRWKEKFLVPDHRVRDINGASFAGFYYVCVELGESAGRPPSEDARGRSNSNVSMASATTGGHSMSSPAASPTLSHAAASTFGTSPPTVSGAQWYAARTQRRRELSLSAPSSYALPGTNINAGNSSFGQPHLAHQYHQQQQQPSSTATGSGNSIPYYHPIYHPHSPHAASPSGPGFWPASPTSPNPSIGANGEDTAGGMWPDLSPTGEDGGYDDLGATGKMSGFYFHENSEPYQQLSLHHTPEASSCAFEMR